MALPFQRPFVARRDGSITVRLSGTERQVLHHTFGELRELLLGPGDASLARLTPIVHPDDAEAEADWQRWMHDELLQSRLGSLDVVERTIDQDSMTPNELTALLQSGNALRLVLGSRLGVAEDDEPTRTEITPDSPDAAVWAVFNWLGYLIDSAVRVLTKSLDPPLDQPPA